MCPLQHGLLTWLYAAFFLNADAANLQCVRKSSHITVVEVRHNKSLLQVLCSIISIKVAVDPLGV